MNLSSKTDFYVYIYLDPRKPGSFIYEEYVFGYEPFYVGKGRNYRYKYHLWNNSKSNSMLLGKIKKIKESLDIEPLIIKIKTNLRLEQSFELEKKLIKMIGRYDLKLGPLCNFTDGGDGSINCTGRKWTKEQREKLMKYRKEHPPRLGKKNSEETKKKQSLAKKGRKLTPSHKKALSGRKFTKEHKEKLSNKKNKKITCYNLEGKKIDLEFKNAFEMANYYQISIYQTYRILTKNKIFNQTIFKR